MVSGELIETGQEVCHWTPPIEAIPNGERGSTESKMCNSPNNVGIVRCRDRALPRINFVVIAE